ncbi:hypothetical protein SeMB42_g01945 [Synchytrium endobioticum]|uniref:Uncharacterized protein n=1 Tax=Synchytrium endobioticum TaxID=286115 RepID=A0A507DCV1_9FUNG|nr:hypothetical protein SeLEV6574_g01647 [Synchytrium endobioticum]TPX51346.1 hypothetical protein SeMB42_g01943 [Synchytrium endobioticum]TPX51348.1 hypothetical protein SeMB42_g01945 [Synchytrium endobioticum]
MVFDGMISTNGTDVSVYLKHENALRRGSTRKSKSTLRAEVKQLYVENHLPELRSAANIVAIDPNKRDILYCQGRNNNINLWSRRTSGPRKREAATTASREMPSGPAMIGTHRLKATSSLLRHARTISTVGRRSSTPKGMAHGAYEKAHGLLGCTHPNCVEQAWNRRKSSNQPTCWNRRYWDRDQLSTYNMLRIIGSMLAGLGGV